MRRFKWSLLAGFIFFIVLFLVIIFFKSAYQKKANRLNNQSNQPRELTTKPQTSEVSSPDGTMKLIMQEEPRQDLPKTYSFFVTNTANKDNKRLLFVKTKEAKEKMMIPHNSWSPDNKYVFLGEKDEYGNLNFLVLKANGDSFTNNEKYLDVGLLFSQKKTGHRLYDATGWASPVFLNIETLENSRKKGPSYWFDVTSLSFWGHQ